MENLENPGGVTLRKATTRREKIRKQEIRPRSVLLFSTTTVQAGALCGTERGLQYVGYMYVLYRYIVVFVAKQGSSIVI